MEELKHNNISQRVEIINKFPKNKESSENNNRKKIKIYKRRIT